MGFIPSLLKGFGSSDDGRVEAVVTRDSIVSSLKNCGVSATRGLMLSQDTGKFLVKIPADLKMSGLIDPRDCELGRTITLNDPSCLIRRFL